MTADIPLEPLAEAAPEYDRPWEATPLPPAPPADEVPDCADPATALRTLIGCPDLASRRWVWEQYDSEVMAATVLGPGRADAALVRVHGAERALAMTTDCTPRYCLAHPETGGAQAVAEAWRNITATGATPLAMTDNMNFGNPENPAVMGQFAGCVAGMRAASVALSFPVVSGNVSLYNETDGAAIPPTPVIGGVGAIADWRRARGVGIPGPDLGLVLIGETTGHLCCSLYMRTLHGREDGPPPPVDLKAERRNGDFVRMLIAEKDGLILACHDLSDGGLAVAVAEMALAGDVGAELEPAPAGLTAAQWLFGEDQARYLLATTDSGAVLAFAAAAGAPARAVGRSRSETLTLAVGHTISVADLRQAHESWFAIWMRDTAAGTA